MTIPTPSNDDEAERAILHSAQNRERECNAQVFDLHRQRGEQVKKFIRHDAACQQAGANVRNIEAQFVSANEADDQPAIAAIAKRLRDARDGAENAKALLEACNERLAALDQQIKVAKAKCAKANEAVEAAVDALMLAELPATLGEINTDFPALREKVRAFLALTANGTDVPQRLLGHVTPNVVVAIAAIRFLTGGENASVNVLKYGDAAAVNEVMARRARLIAGEAA